MDSPNKFDWEKPGTTQAEIQDRREGALQARHEQLLQTVRRWNDLARVLGYEGVGAMVEHLAAHHTSREQQ
jgi:hypothetical protein